MSIRIVTWAAVLLAVVCAPAYAAGNGPKVPSVPVAPVEQTAVPAAPATPVVVELFSSQACTFCPQADKLFGDLIKQPNVIGLACHVDYFDVHRGALSHPFCTERQTWYEEQLHLGPNYTPQLIMQGQIDAIGYKADVVDAAMKQAHETVIAPLKIESTQADAFTLTLPADWKVEQGTDTSLWLMLYDKPHEVKVAGGANRGQDVTYYNIVSAMKDAGTWPAGQPAMSVTPGLAAAHQGFVALLQNKTTGKILAAGKYETK
ncbi:MAG TPA: DUF1223 domain-containing protein [Patescibacteria group bacterium]|nr:DUF1223 domain-containing protein [Patescibacteria group bacterium]